MNEHLTAQQRAQYFNVATRQNEHMLPKQTATAPLTTLNFNLPKNRLLSKIRLGVTAKFAISHASKTTVDANTDELWMYKFLSRVSVDLNNGFSPYVATGKEIALLNMVGLRGDMVKGAESGTLCKVPTLKASTGGTSNAIEFVLDLPVTLNDRDTAGLILLQNNETNVTLTVDIATPNFAPEGYTFEIEEVTVTPCIQTYTVPAVEQAFPDLSVLKLVHSKTESYVGGGENTVKLNCGTIYRKLVLFIQDAEGKGVADDAITSTIQLVFNQADTPYSISPKLLRAKNTAELGYEMPKGVYVFDFSYAGMSNYAGTRDYIDTERLTEFWVKFATAEAGRITVISENLTRLV